MNGLHFSPTVHAAAASPLTSHAPSHAAHILAAADLLLPDLARGRRITTPIIRSAMEAATGGSDSYGSWLWRDAYEACEVAQVLFLRKYGPSMRRQAAKPTALLAMLSRVAALLPTQTRRSEESQSFQQFSTPIDFGFVAAVAAGVTDGDVVLEPSAGTGLLASLVEQPGVTMALNELAPTRADLLGMLFPSIAVTRHDAAQIDDHLGEGCSPTVVLMNPPFSVAAHVDGTVRDAAFQHLVSAFARFAGRRPTGRDHRSEHGAGCATVARRFHPPPGPWARRVLRRH